MRCGFSLAKAANMRWATDRWVEPFDDAPILKADLEAIKRQFPNDQLLSWEPVRFNLHKPHFSADWAAR